MGLGRGQMLAHCGGRKDGAAPRGGGGCAEPLTPGGGSAATAAAPVTLVSLPLKRRLLACCLTARAAIGSALQGIAGPASLWQAYAEGAEARFFTVSAAQPLNFGSNIHGSWSATRFSVLTDRTAL
jgi:hypothetical protein